MLTQQLINGLTTGLVYALLALGLSLAYSTTKIVNFAHGEVVVLGAFVGLTVQRQLHVSYPLACLTAAAVVFVFVAAFTYWALWNLRSPLHRSVATIALGLGLRDLLLLIFGSDSESFLPVYPQGSLVLAGASVSWASIIICGVTGALLVLVALGLRVSRWGIWMRAVAQDEELAATSGIRTRRVQAVAFGLGSVLAALGGLMVGPVWQVNYGAGTNLGLKAFTAALLGGMGSVSGAVLGGIAVGVLEAMLAGYVSSTWKDSGVYMSLILVLLLFPRGIAGMKRLRTC